MRALIEKTNESLSSVIPITAIVLLLSISIAPLTPGALILFLFGAVLLVAGMGLFTLGVDMSMLPMGEGVGVELAKRKRMGIPLLVCFILGVVITIAEPDLQVLAHQIPSIPNMTLILAVALGVGVFLSLALIRIRRKIPCPGAAGVLHHCFHSGLLHAGYSFVPAPFDSGGVTTGPITVPFIMALGIGMASMRNDKTPVPTASALSSRLRGTHYRRYAAGYFHAQPQGGNFSMAELGDIQPPRMRPACSSKPFPPMPKRC